MPDMSERKNRGVQCADLFTCLATQYLALVKKDARGGVHTIIRDYDAMVSNGSVIAMELLDHYAGAFPFPRADVVNHPEEMNRMIILQKHHYISVISAFEFAFSTLVNEYPESDWYAFLHRKEKYIARAEALLADPAICAIAGIKKIRRFLKSLPPINTMRRVLERAQTHELVTKDVFDTLLCLFTIRNALTHNNGVSSITLKVKLGPTMIDLKEGVMIRGEHNMICRLAMYFFDHTLDLLVALHEAMNH